MTAFWNFVALGHQNAQITTMQKRDFNSVIPGFRLFLFEPAASETDPQAGDTRQHLNNLFYQYTLPFQQLHIKTSSDQTVKLVFLKSQHSFRHTALAKHQRSSTAGHLNLRVVGQSTDLAPVEHYECCHKLLPLNTNIEALTLTHHALGFLKNNQPSDVKQIYLEEVFEDSDDETGERHCLKLMNGDLFCFCNINTRDQFIAINQNAFDEASCVSGHKAPASIKEDVKSLVDGLTLPMNEDQLYRHQKSQFQYEGDSSNGSKSINRSFIGLMQHKTNDLARFLEIKYRYWSLLKAQLPKPALSTVQPLFKSDQKLYLFKSQDQNTEVQNSICNQLRPIFY